MNRNVLSNQGERFDKLEEWFARELPKVELNANLNGSLTTETLAKLGCPRRSMAKYEKLSKCPPANKTLQDCSELFELAHKLMRTPKSVYIATKSVIDEFVKDNVIYLELRTTPKAEDGMSKQEYIESVVRGIQESELEAAITVKLILSIDRTHSREASTDSLNVIIKMREKFPETIKGISLTGDPEQGYFDESLFQVARNSGLYTTIPCGEISNDLEVGRILKFMPDRVSYCENVHPLEGGCNENFELYCKAQMPIECCMTSNIISGQNYFNPNTRSWKFEYPSAICTVNKGIFGTTLSREYVYFHHYYRMEPMKLWQMTFSSLWSSFASPEEKMKIDTILNNRLYGYFAGVKLDLPLEYVTDAERRRLDIGSYQM